MSMLVTRSQIVEELCTYLRVQVPEIKLIKPYTGELDRYSKKIQIQESSFPAMVNLTTPFALVISKDRKRIEDKGASLKFRHDLSIYIGVSNRHDFNSLTAPDIFPILTKCVDVLHGHVFVRGAGALNVESDGEYLITNDLFTVYDQKYYQLEIGR